MQVVRPGFRCKYWRFHGIEHVDDQVAGLATELVVARLDGEVVRLHGLIIQRYRRLGHTHLSFISGELKQM